MKTVYFEKNIPKILLTAELLLNGKLNTDGFITHRYPLERWQEAVLTAGDKNSGAIKVVLDYRKD